LISHQSADYLKPKGGNFMGKGDKRTKRGKISRGTYGVRRPKKKDQKEN
jgi:30S ribosomal protein S31